MKIISRQEAISLGLKHYFNGIPCKRSHIAKRFVSGGCMKCFAEAAKEKYRRDPAAGAARARAARQADPERARAKKSAWRRLNRDKENSYSRDYRKRYPEKVWAQQRSSLLKREYGLTIEQWDFLFISQGRACGLCCSEAPGGNGRWCTDHCHKTGRVRGILCHTCNRALGLLKDDPNILRRAADYVAR